MPHAIGYLRTKVATKGPLSRKKMNFWLEIWRFGEF